MKKRFCLVVVVCLAAFFVTPIGLNADNLKQIKKLKRQLTKLRARVASAEVKKERVLIGVESLNRDKLRAAHDRFLQCRLKALRKLRLAGNRRSRCLRKSSCKGSSATARRNRRACVSRYNTSKSEYRDAKKGCKTKHNRKKAMIKIFIKKVRKTRTAKVDAAIAKAKKRLGEVKNDLKKLLKIELSSVE